MKLKFAFGIATAAMLLVGCGDDSVTNINDEAKAKGQMTLKIIDSNTGVAIDSAEVFSLIDGKSFYSDTNGVTSWKKKDIGTYEYTVTKEGYATRTVKVDLMENGEGNIARVEDKMVDVRMYKLGVSVKGTVLLADPQTGNQSAAEKATVVLKYADSFIVPQEVETVTNSSGVFEFEDLAEGLEYTVSVPQYAKKSFTYAYDGSKNVLEALRSGEQKTLEQITMKIVGLAPELINDNIKAVDVADSVKMTFSVALLADSVPNAWRVYKNSRAVDGEYCSEGSEVLVTASLGDDNKTIKISPVSNLWSKLSSYCLVGSVITKEGYELEVAKTFVPGSAVSKPENVEKPTATPYYDDYIQLTWEAKDEAAKGYRLFFRTDKSADYVEFENWYTGVDSLPIDSTKCRSKLATYSTTCEEQIEAYGASSRNDVNYYWYTKHKASSNATQYNEELVPYYTDSTSATYMWSKKVETDADDLEWNSREYVFVWTTKSAMDSCDVTYDEYMSGDDYASCAQYTEYGSYYTYKSLGYTADDEPYRRYYWKITKDLAAADTCVTSYSSYSYCTQYSDYGTTPVSTIGTVKYYKTVADSSTKCTLKYDSYAYEGCDAYEDRATSPYSTTLTYWHFTYTDSVSCTVKSGSSFDMTPACLAKAESYGSYNTTDNTYFWYTKKASVRPGAADEMAFVRVNSVLTEGATSVKFIILPYTVIDDEIITASVEDATTTNAYAVKTEEAEEEAEEKAEEEAEEE